jgi:glycosyltransferase involved in cell wall biosynthesis
MVKRSAVIIGSMPRVNAASARTWIALLGRGDATADGVQDYCEYLARALERQGVELNLVRVDWAGKGWWAALRDLRRECEAWEAQWILLQFTALAWSRRGFPFGVLAVLAVVRRGGARCAVVFHEPYSPEPATWFDHARCAFQGWIIRKIYRSVEKSVFPETLQRISWLPHSAPRARFIPIGANIPERNSVVNPRFSENGQLKTVVVFCLTGMPYLRDELKDISDATRIVIADGVKLRLLFLGRGAFEAQEEIAHSFRDLPIEVSNLGLLDAVQISDIFANSHAMLCVRGKVYLRRGSAIAGIACGLPIIGYEGESEGTPLDDAGLILVPYRDGRAAGAALSRVLRDQSLRHELQKKSERAQQKHFSWNLIASAFVNFLESTQL